MDTQNNAGQSSTTVETTKTVNHKGDRVLMGVLSYLGPLVVIPLLVKKDDPFVKFHTKQGLVLLSIKVIIWILNSLFFLWALWPLYGIINLALLILAIIGIVNVVEEKEKELPIVGGFSHYFKF